MFEHHTYSHLCDYSVEQTTLDNVVLWSSVLESLAEVHEGVPAIYSMSVHGVCITTKSTQKATSSSMFTAIHFFNMINFYLD